MRASTNFVPLHALVIGLGWLAFGSCGTGTEPSPDAGGTTGGCETAGCPTSFHCVAGVCIRDDEPCADRDGDGFSEDEECGATADCDDTRADMSPGLDEVCGDGIDNDCNWIVDDRSLCTPCIDECDPGEALCAGDRILYCDDSSGCALLGDPVDCADGLACRDGACIEVCVDADRDGFTRDCGTLTDCDDARGDVYPGGVEVCDGLDNNCDRRTDENFICEEPCTDACTRGTIECTGDGRGMVSCVLSPDGCLRWSGTIPCLSGEACSDGLCSATPVCVDVDGDGYGPGCEPGPDCRAGDAFASPAGDELCNGLDDDCNRVADDGNPCASCLPAPVSSPVTGSPGTPLYRVACGGEEYISLGGVQADVAMSVVVSGGETPLAVALGHMEGGSFVSDAAGFPLGSATGVLHRWTSSRTAVLRVGAPAGLRYGLVASTEGPGWSCRPDLFEPNNAPGAAADVGVAPFLFAGSVCAGDFDFFTLDISTGSTLAASLVYSGSEERDLIVSLWRNGAEVSPSFAGPPSSTGAPDGRHAFFRTDLPGTYVVGVRASQPGEANDYALSVSLTPPGSCTEDAGETAGGLDNDSFATARDLSAGSTFSGSLCPGDFDIFRLGTLTGHLTGDLTFRVSDGNLDGLLLHDSWGGISQERATNGDNERFDNALSADGVYYLVVFGRGALDSAPYTLRYANP